MSKIIQQTVTFKASPHEVYETLLDSARHAAFSGSPAEISREVGGAYSAYDGYISGKNIKLVPDREIVQSWRAVYLHPDCRQQGLHSRARTPALAPDRPGSP